MLLLDFTDEVLLRIFQSIEPKDHDVLIRCLHVCQRFRCLIIQADLQLFRPIAYYLYSPVPSELYRQTKLLRQPYIDLDAKTHDDNVELDHFGFGRWLNKCARFYAVNKSLGADASKIELHQHRPTVINDIPKGMKVDLVIPAGDIMKSWYNDHGDSNNLGIIYIKRTKQYLEKTRQFTVMLDVNNCRYKVMRYSDYTTVHKLPNSIYQRNVKYPHEKKHARKYTYRINFDDNNVSFSFNKYNQLIVQERKVINRPIHYVTKCRPDGKTNNVEVVDLNSEHELVLLTDDFTTSVSADQNNMGFIPSIKNQGQSCKLIRQLLFDSRQKPAWVSESHWAVSTTHVHLLRPEQEKKEGADMLYQTFSIQTTATGTPFDVPKWNTVAHLDSSFKNATIERKMSARHVCITNSNEYQDQTICVVDLLNPKVKPRIYKTKCDTLWVLGSKSEVVALKERFFDDLIYNYGTAPKDNNGFAFLGGDMTV